MKVYEYKDPKWGKVFSRISGAIHKFAPVTFVPTMKEADIAFVHIVGNGEETPCKEAIEQHKDLVIFQHCYATTQSPAAWEQYWEQALLVTSFHNLPDYTTKKFNFYGTPLGADEETFFKLPNVKKDIKAFATGHVAETENLREVFEACKAINGTMLHTGNNFKYGKPYHYLDYMNDIEFNYQLNRTQYIPCLREIEGFEAMGIEGLFCGARPVVLDLPTYRWYKGHAYFVSPVAPLVPQLINIFNEEPQPIDNEEQQEIIRKFSWRNVVSNLFTQIIKTV